MEVIIMKVKETLKSKFKKVEVIPPKRRKAENQYRENLYKGLPEKKLSRKEKRKRWNASVDAAFAASKGY